MTTSLSRELADFLIEISIALHKHAMYPEGHPSLAPAAAGVTRRAERLFEERATLALGVARQQLVIEGVATDAKNPVLSELAGRLHRHHLGAVTFHRGLRTTEVADVLRTLAVDAERTGDPLGLGPPEQLRVWDHIRLHSVTYERLELLQEDDGTAPLDDKGAKERGLRGAQLWVGLARAALAAEAIAADEAPPTPTEPAVIAKAIDEHPRSAAYDQVIVGYLLQIADELKSTGGAEAAALRRRTSKLVGALQAGTLRRLIEMGGDNAQRTKFAIDATHGLAVDAVLDIVRAMADASHKTVSDPLVRMLSKLAQHAEQGTAAARPQADEALREQVRDLLTGWTLDDPNPDAYGRALHRMVAAATPAQQRSEIAQTAEPLRILQTALESGVLGFAAWRAVERLLAENNVGALVQLLESSPGPSGSVDPLWARITAPDVVRQLACTEPPDFPTLDHVLPRLPVTGFEPLLDVLGASESRTTRRGLLDRLTRAPHELGARIVARLAGEIPWYVTRNLLLILDGLPVLPDGFSAAAFLAHPDVRVRREAVKVALKIPAERERALLGGLQDSDARMARLALTAALEHCPQAALPLVTQLAQDHATASELRVLAIKVLGRTGNTTALATLLQIVDGGTSWLGRARLAARSLEVLAALMALSTGWRGDTQAAKLLALAASSADPDLRNAAIGTRR